MDKLYFVADEDDKGKRLDVFLAENLTDVSRSRVKTIADKGLTYVNDIPQKGRYEIKSGDKISVEIPPVRELSLLPEDIPVDIVYEDDSLAVINKAQGMVVHPANGNESGTLVNALLYKLKSLSSINGVARPGIVHRIDKDTSGLLIVAKTDRAHKILSEQIADKSAYRYYIALVDGNIKEDCGTIDAPVGRSPRDRKLMAIVENGRKAVTDYKVIERYGKYTLVEYKLHTGRTHQIRVHSKYIHHSVVGDEAYGGSNAFKLNGQLLHAYKLIFTHPTTGEVMEFLAPLPDYFIAVLRKLGSDFKI